MNNTFFSHLAHEFDLPFINPVLVFSVILFIILLAPILLGKIKIPAIIGLIISGIVIGPHGFNILQKNSAIDLFSTIGLLYIMFIAGLELDLIEFKKYKHKSLVFGFFTFFIPMSIGLPACYYLLGYSLQTSFLVASMFSTHTLIAYPIVSKLGISKNEAVAITVGGTILTDTAVLIILAVIMGSENGGLTTQFWIHLAITLSMFSAIMFLIIPRIAKWFFSKLESEKSSHYIFVLSVVFFAAFLAQVAGVEAIIGAFVAGLALNKLIPHSSALMNRIDFVGNTLFIPFFLISVGMLVDVRVVLSGPVALIVAGTLTVVAVTGKWISAYFVQKIYGYSKDQRNLIFGLSSAHAAATLAIILVGFKAGILDENILNGTIILILVTCVVASVFTQKAALNIVLMEDEGNLKDEKPTLSSENILIPIADFTKIEPMLDFAALLKEKKSIQPIYILSVVPNNNDAEINLKKVKKKLSETAKYASASDTIIEIMATIDHNISSGIVRASKEKEVTLILNGWRRKTGFIEKFLGDKTDNMVEETNTTVFVCHLTRALNTHRNLILVCPPLAEYEEGFPVWLNKIGRLASELSITIDVFCNVKTITAIRAFIEKQKVNATFSFTEFDEWNDFSRIKIFSKPDDILIVVSSRKGTLSYQPGFENTQKMLERKFSDLTTILIYPAIRSF
nr:cation:proton antiporter [uncultured Pedobacter sp.]